MEKKSWIQVIVVIVYLILIAIFWRIETYELNCKEDYDVVCVTFCSTDENELSDSFIRANFHMNDTILDFFDDYKINRGRPMCINTKVYDPNDYKSEVLDEENDIFFDTRLQFYYFTPHQYCKEKIEVNGEIKWETIICNNSQTFRFIFHGIAIALSVIILAFILSVYLFFKQLHDFNGICILHFLFPLLLMFLFQPTLHYDELLSFKVATYLTVFLEILYVFGFMWISVMCFDMFWVFFKLHRNIEEDIPYRLQIYMIFTFSFTFFTTIIYVIEINSFTIFQDFVTFIYILEFVSKLMTGIDLIFFVLAIYFKYQCMLNYDAENYAKYEDENRWFWIRFQIIAVLLATFSIEIYSLRSENIFEVFLISDFLKFFCTIVIALILIPERDDVIVLLIEKYNEFKSRSGGIYFVNNLA
ncbi:hypothetical protein PVAND_010798 [Polypedilum vanderplanki]|uniref:Uncharacterized protein n=1 Tax=Polypedilum vanderplanki TaxID=319348 RepID=A0A9J6CGN3_POLVA|nr:hypothetical protein PVAND_010798 [Polypedilum vanderplanki]